MNESHLVSLQFKKQVLKRKNESFSFLHVHGACYETREVKLEIVSIKKRSLEKFSGLGEYTYIPSKLCILYFTNFRLKFLYIPFLKKSFLMFLKGTDGLLA